MPTPGHLANKKEVKTQMLKRKQAEDKRALRIGDIRIIGLVFVDFEVARAPIVIHILCQPTLLN